MKAFTLLAAPAEYGQITINWNPRYLSDNMVLMCDDTSLSGVELAVKGNYSVGGRLSPESYMAFESCGADWKITKKQLVEKNGEVFTLIRLRGGSACTLKVSEKPTPGVQPKAFTLEISDAC